MFCSVRMLGLTGAAWWMLSSVRMLGLTGVSVHDAGAAALVVTAHAAARRRHGAPLATAVRHQLRE